MNKLSLLNFICIGAQKAGTTTLHDILNQHPDVFLPKVKETKFFHDNTKFNKGLDYYQNEFFNSHKTEKVSGEIDPEYLYFNEVPKRIFDALGIDTKLIIIMRNPANRAYSHYLMSVRRGFETENFEDAIRLEKERILENDFNKNHFSYIDRGLYSEQIKRYLQYFKKENMLFLIFEEDLIQNKEETFKRILKFLELDPDYAFDLDIKSNPSSKPRFTFIRDLVYKPGIFKKVIGNLVIPSKKLRWKFKDLMDKYNQKSFSTPKLDSEMKELLMKKYFKEDIKHLEKILDRGLSVWKKV